MVNKPEITRGTIYLQGPQSHFHASIARALNLNPAHERITYQISTDLIQTLKNDRVTYRVDYVAYRTCG